MRATDAALIVFALLVALSFVRAHRDADFAFNLFDLIMENGRLSRMACAFMVTLVLTTWLMIRIALDGKMTEQYLLVFGGMWVAPIIAKMFGTSSSSSMTTTVLNPPNTPNPPNLGTITTMMSNTVGPTKGA